MPQATDENRYLWNGPGEETAMNYLYAVGWELTRDWYWKPPPRHKITDQELSAIGFLIDEWDFGGLA